MCRLAGPILLPPKMGFRVSGQVSHRTSALESHDKDGLKSISVSQLLNHVQD